LVSIFFVKMVFMCKKAIIVGASSGIGESLAKIMSAKGYILGLTGRRVDLLEALAGELPEKAVVQVMDVSKVLDAEEQFSNLIQNLGKVDLVIIAAGTGQQNLELESALEVETINTNVIGFTIIAGMAFNHFKNNQKGHLVGISSIMALRGSSDAPAYSASKAYISNYMQGLRVKAFKEKLDVTITDIRPGFVDTAMAKGDGLFWVSSPEKAALQIFDAIEAGKSCAYITKRWRLIAWFLKVLPESLYRKL